MRALLVTLSIFMLPSTGWAACTCSCSQGQAHALCSSSTDIAPICLQICPAVIEQRVEPQSLGPYGGRGGGGGGELMERDDRLSSRNPRPPEPSPSGMSGNISGRLSVPGVP